MQQTYKFNKSDFDDNGLDNNGKLFSDKMYNWEEEFHKEFHPFFTNHLYANNSTMLLLKSCLMSTNNEDYGMDGEYDLDTNLEIEAFSERQTIYAMGSELTDNKGEPVFLIRDDKVSDGTVVLKYIPDSDDEAIEPKVPIESNVIVGS